MGQKNQWQAEPAIIFNREWFLLCCRDCCFYQPNKLNRTARFRASNAKRIALELMPQANTSMSLPEPWQFCCSILASGEYSFTGHPLQKNQLATLPVLVVFVLLELLLLFLSVAALLVFVVVRDIEQKSCQLFQSLVNQLLRFLFREVMRLVVAFRYLISRLTVTGLKSR